MISDDGLCPVIAHDRAGCPVVAHDRARFPVVGHKGTRRPVVAHDWLGTMIAHNRVSRGVGHGHTAGRHATGITVVSHHTRGAASHQIALPRGDTRVIRLGSGRTEPREEWDE
jgi:hypothetical protein